MIKKIKKSKTAFTLIELLVVIAIIGLISTIAVVALNDSRQKARDAKRKADLKQAQTAIGFYYDTYGDYIGSGSGYGSGGNGNGWFNYSGGSYPESIAQALVDEGFTATEIIDPTGGRTSSPTANYTYMKYHCGTPTRAYVYAKLENVAQSSTATDGTCCPGCDSSYGMNYYLQIQ